MTPHLFYFFRPHPPPPIPLTQGAVNVDTLACDSLGLVRSLLDLVTARLRAVHGETVHTMMTADVAKQAWTSLREFHHWSPMPTHGLQLWRSVCDRLSSEYTSFLFPATAQVCAPFCVCVCVCAVCVFVPVPCVFVCAFSCVFVTFVLALLCACALHAVLVVV